MGLADTLIIILVVACSFAGYRRGAILESLQLIGILIGLLIGFRIGYFIDSHINQSTLILPILLTVSIGATIPFYLLATKLGRRIKTKIMMKKAYSIDRYSGIFIGLLSAFIFVWLGSAIIFKSSSTNIQNLVLSSKIVGYIDQKQTHFYTSTSAIQIFDPNFSVNNNGNIFNDPPPVLGGGIAPSTLPTKGPLVGAISQDVGSTVEIWEKDCNQLFAGSGYVAAPHLVITAAHVVAGAGEVVVYDLNGSYTGTVVMFDDKYDVAAVYAPELNDPPLVINTQIPKQGTPVAALGYPGVKTLDIHTGTTEQYKSKKDYFGAGVYIDPTNSDSSPSTKFLSVLTNLVHGDSGSPLIMADGTVIGHASLGSDAGSSYFISTESYIDELRATTQNIHRVSTGWCPVSR